MSETTRGQVALEKALENRIGEKSGRNWLAETLGLTQSAISRWCTGAGRPEAHHRRAISALLSIPEDAWWTSEEASIVRKALRIGPVKYAQAHTVSKAVRASSGTGR